MRNLLVSSGEAAELIRTSKSLLLAAAEPVLSHLPRGTWIGGTTSYFMGPDGGVIAENAVFCTVLDDAADACIAVLPPDDLAKVTDRQFSNGFTFIILPAFSKAHSRYAIEGPTYPGLYASPVIGWISGVNLADVGTRSPKVFDGSTGIGYANAAAVMHVTLPPGISANVDIVNLFTQGQGDSIEFDDAGFSATTCRINGVPAGFADYLLAKSVDTRLPLVASYAGAMVNVSFRSVSDGRVEFYAPVEPGVLYRLAAPVAEYASSYRSACTTADAHRQLSCNCILNFLYARLEGVRTGGFVGPVTFGEIAYILLNQTLVRLELLSSTIGDH